MFAHLLRCSAVEAIPLYDRQLRLLDGGPSAWSHFVRPVPLSLIVAGAHALLAHFL